MGQLDTILLVDDDEITNFIHTALLKNLKLADNIMVAKNGKEALGQLTGLANTNEVPPTLVMLDLNMPVMNGFEFLEAFQQFNGLLKKSVYIVVVTSSLNPRDIERVGELGVNDFLSKPLNEEKLKKVVENRFQ